MAVIDTMKFALLCLSAVAGGAASAQPVQLDCKLRSTIDGSPFGDGEFRQTLIVDFENKRLQFANWTPLPIIKVNERFVTALGVVFDASPVGGFVISLNRDDGQFMLRGIGPSDDGMSDRQMDGTCALRGF